MRNIDFNPVTGDRLFAGESDQEKAATGYYDEIGGIDPNVQNRFDNYNNPFDFDDISGKLDEIFGESESKINRDITETSAGQKRNMAGSLASKGITGGSILNDIEMGIDTNANKNRMNVLGELHSGRAQGKMNLMDMFNKMNFAKTQAAQNVDFGNKRNLFSKMQLQGGALQGLDDDTWLDDTFAGMNAAGNLAQGIGSIVKSDIRFKKNIKKVDEVNGINIYEFQYINNSRRYRGVMAQEVENIIPGSVVEINGIKFVDYSKLPNIIFQEI